MLVLKKRSGVFRGVALAIFHRNGYVPRKVHLAQASPCKAKTVTVRFCDLVGAIRVSQELNAEQWRELLARYHQVCGDLVQVAEGHVAQYLGDGVLAYFGWPQLVKDAGVTRD